MTYIEFFDRQSTENVSACLTYAPQRVIYIGDNSKLMKRYIARYQRVFADRGQEIEFLCRTVSKSNLDDAVALLTELVETYDDCVFDITGGEELLILALGVVCAQHPDKNIQIHKFNLRNNAIYDYDKDGKTIFRETPVLSVEENVRIYGGDVVYGGVEEAKTYRWDLNDGFLQDLSVIWELCRDNVRLWNIQIGIFAVAALIGSTDADGLTVTVSRADLDRYMLQNRIQYRPVKSLIAQLRNAGLLTGYREDATALTVTFKDLQVKRCLARAGQALEMKVFVTAKQVLDKDDIPVYNDAINGVLIDWDGEFHDEEAEESVDTENEIDVLLMHDVIPVFISCKNGYVTSDELYKLDSVAEHFGGQYAKKVLVATSIDSMGEAGKYVRQRAKDMGIRLLENIQELDDEALSRALKNLWSN